MQIRHMLRACPWLLAAIATTIGVAVVAPFQLGVLLWSLSKVCLGAYLGYWLDRSFFPYARPHEQTGPELQLAGLRRAVIAGAIIVALGLGV